MATYYWVGGNGTWDNVSTANWAASSGGAGGSGPPLSADTVIFDASSGTGTCTTATGSACAVATLNSSTLGLTLGANHTMSGLFTLTLGALNLNDKVLSAGLFQSSNSNVRSIAFGVGNITCTGNNGAVFNILTATNFSYTGTSQVNCTYSGAVGTRSIYSGNAGGTAANALNINITAGSDVIAFGNGFTIQSLNFTGFTGSINNVITTIYGNLTYSAGMTIAAGTFATTFAATSGIQQLTTNTKTLDFPITQNGVGGTVQLQDNLTMGSTRTFTLTAGDLHINNKTLSTGLFSSSNSNTRIIDFKSGNITTTGSGTVWTTATPTNFSYLGTPTVNISNNSATATTVSTGAMTAAQALNFNYTTGTYTLTDTAAVYKTVNFTGFAGTIPNSVRTIYGGLTFSAGMTLTAGANATTFVSTAAGNTITSAGKTQDYPIIFNGVGGVWACQDALTQGSTRAFTITNGTVQLKASATSTTGAFATSGTTQKFLQSTTPGTQATLTQASGTVDATYLTVKDNNATGGATWNALWSNNNVDEGNNSGWIFGDPPVTIAAEYTYQLRSFTQPRRF